MEFIPLIEIDPKETDLEKIRIFDRDICKSGIKSFFRLSTDAERQDGVDSGALNKTSDLPKYTKIEEITPGMRAKFYYDDITSIQSIQNN